MTIGTESDAPRHAVEHNPARGFGFALAGAAILAITAFVLAKYAMRPDGGFPPALFALIWTASSSTFLLVALAARGRLAELRLPRAALWHVVGAGLIGGFAHIFFWSGLALLDPSFAAFLMRFSPVLVILLSAAFLGERLSGFEIAGAVVMVVGGCVSALGDWQAEAIRTGLVLMLLCCVTAATWRVLIKARSDLVHPMVGNFYRLALAAVVIAPWTLWTSASAADVAADSWVVLFVGAVCGPCIGMSLVFNSYRYWELSKTSMVVMLQPLIVLPIAAFMPQSTLTRVQLLGGMIILVGGLWVVWQHSRRERRPARSPETPAPNEMEEEDRA
ncbi:MAG: DMT family transporter [Planctomycetota bacterium]